MLRWISKEQVENFTKTELTHHVHKFWPLQADKSYYELVVFIGV